MSKMERVKSEEMDRQPAIEGPFGERAECRLEMIKGLLPREGAGWGEDTVSKGLLRRKDRGQWRGIVGRL